MAGYHNHVRAAPLLRDSAPANCFKVQDGAVDSQVAAKLFLEMPIHVERTVRRLGTIVGDGNMKFGLGLGVPGLG